MEFIRYILRRKGKIAFYLFIFTIATAVSVTTLINLKDSPMWMNMLVLNFVKIMEIIAFYQPYKEWIDGGRQE